MKLFGCNNHHWKGGINKREYRIVETESIDLKKLEEKYEYRCQHEGCDGSKIEWKPVGKFHPCELTKAIKRGELG
jgi:hypothetical protein